MTNDQYMLLSLDESALAQEAQKLASVLHGGAIIYLEGDLGAGKTTFARALLRALGVGERVKSPTYSLIESYDITHFRIHHLDLYRIADAGELEWLGLPDLLGHNDVLLIEWPERGQGVLPVADILIRLSYTTPDTRNFEIVGYTEIGRRVVVACCMKTKSPLLLSQRL